MSEESKPGRDYHVPDPPPPLPSGPDAVDPQTKYVLELYAAEIREHASGILSIYGLSPGATDSYKRHCFDAASQLEAAAQILRQNGKVRDVTIVKEAPKVEVPRVEYSSGDTKAGGWSLLGKFFGRGVAPCLIVVLLGHLAMRLPAVREFVSRLVA